ncbi:MAG: GDP-mannose 4,6-dehydratase [Gemmataceae bacterium]|nr:GDP-mannose 4,6-dehydratase [Gemmataceae bacterium]
MKILVTGGSGFIGSAFVRYLLQYYSKQHSIRCLVRDTNQRHWKRLWAFDHVRAAESDGSLHVIKGDLLGDLSDLCEYVDWVVHFAAKTFVDHSIRDPLPFIETNVIGTYRLLEDARRNRVKRFVHVSTDEVYGSIPLGSYAEDARTNPTNPYAASKAGADALVLSYAHSFGLHTTVTRTENNYGIMQHPQKALPVFVKAACENRPLPVYGDGQHVRQWLWVEDHVRGILRLLESDYPPGEVFHIAGNQELTNLELAKRVLRILGKSQDRIELVPDQDIRPGHDRRYALQCDKLKQLGWAPQVSLDEGLPMAVNWYADNRWWLE